MSDPASYRTKEELEKYRLEDPIIRLRAQLTREGKLTNEQFDALDKKAKDAALASVKFAETSPEPPLEDLYAYTYVDDGVEPHQAEEATKAGSTASSRRTPGGTKSRRTTNAKVWSNGEQA
jgi:TPP-dependent pyruvate/acetoin dehydrogenase alpha subunit